MILAKALPVAVLRSSATINQDMKALIPKDGIISEYIALVLNGSKRRILGVVARSTHGTCRLETDKLLSIPIRKLQVRDNRRLVAKEIGRAVCRDRGGQKGWISEGGVTLKKKEIKI